jgi:acetyltransferase-like isoleucine patch superfamily enzyme
MGAHAFVKSGVTIGDGAVVAARGHYRRPPYAIVGGNLARVMLMRFPNGIIEWLLAAPNGGLCHLIVWKHCRFPELKHV